MAIKEILTAHPLIDHEITVETVLRGELARTLIEHAEARHKRPIDVFADLVEIILRENMVDAILDDR